SQNRGFQNSRHHLFLVTVSKPGACRPSHAHELYWWRALSRIRIAPAGKALRTRRRRFTRAAGRKRKTDVSKLRILPEGNSSIQCRLRPLSRVDGGGRSQSVGAVSRWSLSRWNLAERLYHVRLQRRRARRTICPCQPFGTARGTCYFKMSKGVLLVNLGSPDS